MHRLLRLSLMMGVVLALVACDALQSDDDPLPTVADFESVATASFLTQNAPPSGFSTVRFPNIDDGVERLPYSRAEIRVNFTGVYAGTEERAQGSLLIEIRANQQVGSRQVTVTFDGDIFSGAGESRVVAVRLSNNYYMINPNGVCITEASQIQEITGLRAGQIVGGVVEAGATARHGPINGYETWQYGFAPEAFQPPQLQTTDDLDLLVGELWVAPEHQVVVRYIVEMNIRDAVLLFGERPVTGRLRLEYNLYDINQEQNISIPNGC